MVSAMAEVLSVSTTPNPDAMKFTVDRRFDEMFTIASAEDAAAHPFAEAVFAGGGVASVFGTADFVTITRTEGADWAEIEECVRTAAATHL
jgi:hypothetical protein